MIVPTKTHTLTNMYTSVWDYYQDEFVRAHQDSNLLLFENKLTLETAFFDFAREICVMREGNRYFSVDDNVYIFNDYFIAQIRRGACGCPLTPQRVTVWVKILGIAPNAQRFYQDINIRYAEHKLATVDWAFSSGGGYDIKSIVLDKPQKLYDEFYPHLISGVNVYLDKYMQSDASILFMMGAPGTGKTSLIRYMLHKYSTNALITYENELLFRDSIFVDFMTDPARDILIIEDADTMLGSREDENNKEMSRFLNISDGLVKIKRKKIIFTTNLNNFDNVDEALTRPGRCFDAIKFRALTYNEAVAAAEVAGLPVPTGSVTLAELFNPDTHKIERRKIGFAT